MTLPFDLPDWLPWWGATLVAIPVLLYCLLLVLMPFNVFGVKGRLDLIEARLDEIQAELRLLGGPRAERPPPTERPSPPAAEPDHPPARRAATSWQPDPEEAAAPPSTAVPPRRTPERPDRAEPRFDWPR
jgi:hypothetical protein